MKTVAERMSAPATLPLASFASFLGEGTVSDN